MDEIELEDSNHGTQAQGERQKDRPLEWTDKVSTFRTWNNPNGYWINFGCERVQRFKLCEKDYVNIVSIMVASLPLNALLKINKLVANRIAIGTAAKGKETKKMESAKLELQKELSKARDEVWRMREEISRLTTERDKQEH